MLEDDSLKSDDETKSKKSKKDSQQEKDKEDSHSHSDEEKHMCARPLEIIHYLTPETEFKLKRYLKDGETQLTDIEF